MDKKIKAKINKLTAFTIGGKTLRYLGELDEGYHAVVLEGNNTVTDKSSIETFINNLSELSINLFVDKVNIKIIKFMSRGHIIINF